MSMIVEGTTRNAGSLHERPHRGFPAYDRRIVRDICVERSRASSLAARWVTLEGASSDPRTRLEADTARLELKGALRHYTQLLLELGEPRATALELVDELAAEVASHTRGAVTADDLRQELFEFASDVSPTRSLSAPALSSRA
jgi:hypothetical protein